MEHQENGKHSTPTVPEGKVPAPRFRIALPARGEALAQDEEWCVVQVDGQWREIRFHDYADVFEIHGLYEQIFYETLGCQSPKVIAGLLKHRMLEVGEDPGMLRVLDLGAGNGMVGERLRKIGADQVVGIDIVPEAAIAAARDRPGVYDDYLVADMTDLDPKQRDRMRQRRFNCLTCVAALGFGDIPTEVFQGAFDLVEDGGWIAFNIRDRFLEERECTGFSRLIGELTESGTLDAVTSEPYVHRRSTNGTPLTYVAMVGRKRAY